MSKETSKPAFPVVGQWGVTSQGMTLRDYFAAKAMQGFLACGIECGPDDVKNIVESAYIMADAMLKAREQ